MATGLIHLDPKQKLLLARRAELRGTSISQELRAAFDLYLAMPIEIEDQLKRVARTADRSADRIIKKLDETITYVDCVFKSRGRRQVLSDKPQR